MTLAIVAYAILVISGSNRAEAAALRDMQGFAMAEARLEMMVEMPDRWLDVMSVPGHSVVFLRKTDEWWGDTTTSARGRRVRIVVRLSGDLEQDLDTMIHEFQHYIVVVVLGDWGMRSGMHDRIDAGFAGTGYTWWYHSTHPDEKRVAGER